MILEPNAWSTWLGEDSGAAADLMRPAGDDVLHFWPVSRAVNSVRNSGAEMLDRVDDPDAPPPSDAPPGATRRDPLAGTLRAEWTAGRLVLIRKLELFEAGHLDAALTPENRSGVGDSLRAGIALLDGLEHVLRREMVLA